MPRFEPFAGLRYDEELASLSEVIAPPYDIVSPSDREQLADRSPYNAIHVELPVDDDAHGVGRYQRAAALFSAWQNEGALRRDDAPSLYLYRMRFVDEVGEERSTLGVIGALELDVKGTGSVLPHERTMPKPKGDRLDLLRATGINTSPIWGLSLSKGLAVACSEAIGEQLPLVATDDEGVVHEIFPIVDSDAINRIRDLVASTPIVIADGHHRYETATFFREEVNGSSETAGAHDFVMALVVELTPDELVVQPIHRLISGLPEGLDLNSAFSPFFEIEPGPDDPADLTSAMNERGALGLIAGESTSLLVPRPETIAAAEADLDSCRLDVALSALPPHDLAYQHGVRLVADAVERREAQAGILLRPATVDQIAATAHSGERMPPKTTFFYPKPRTGMVFREVGVAPVS